MSERRPEWLDDAMGRLIERCRLDSVSAQQVEEELLRAHGLGKDKKHKRQGK